MKREHWQVSEYEVPVGLLNEVLTICHCCRLGTYWRRARVWTSI